MKKALERGEKILKETCERCCAASKPEGADPSVDNGGDCSSDVEKCQAEASQIIEALQDAVARNYGLGPYPLDGKDPVGGYLCWDWAAIMVQALAHTSPEYWGGRPGVARNFKESQDTDGDGQPDTGPHHWYINLYACGNASADCRVTIDDGFFPEADGSREWVHPGVYPPEGHDYVDGSAYPNPPVSGYQPAS